MGKEGLDKDLEIYFEIKPFELATANNYKVTVHTLNFKNSNHELSNNEIIRATSRANYLVLDNSLNYLKIGESSYLKDGMNILKINYYLNSHPSKL